MRDETPETHYVHIGECDRLRQPVANPALRYGQLNPIYRQLRSRDSARTTVVLQPDYFPHPARGLDSIVQALWPQLVTPVVAGTFSFYAGEFHRFGRNDRTFIAQALAMPDDEEGSS
jgi:hypothetical protein